MARLGRGRHAFIFLTSSVQILRQAWTEYFRGQQPLGAPVANARLRKTLRVIFAVYTSP
jgi:hypothetical protein